MASTNRPNLPSMIEVQHYSIDYTFDGSELRFLQQENTYHSTLSLMVSSFDGEGRMLTGTAEGATAAWKRQSIRMRSLGISKCTRKSMYPSPRSHCASAFRIKSAITWARLKFPCPFLPSLIRLAISNALCRRVSRIDLRGNLRSKG